MIVTHCDPRLAAATPANPARLVACADAVVADNRFPEFVRPICVAARARGLTVVLDADRPTQMSDELFRIATHVVFSSECLRATTGLDDLGAALAAIAGTTPSFLAVTQGPRDVLWREGATLRQSPVFAVEAIDTLGAGDVFHGAFALALAEGHDVVRGAAVRCRGGRTQMHASWRQHGGPAPRRGRSLARGELKRARHQGIKSGRWIEFQLQENSFLDTRQKRGEAKRSFYHALQDYIYFPYRGLPRWTPSTARFSRCCSRMPPTRSPRSAVWWACPRRHVGSASNGWRPTA